MLLTLTVVEFIVVVPVKSGAPPVTDTPTPPADTEAFTLAALIAT